MEQDLDVLEHDFHALGVGHEVRREVAAVELHALDHLEVGVEALGLLHRDDAVLADLVHRLGDDAADLGVVVGRDGADAERSLRRLTGLASCLTDATAAATARSMPRLSSIGLAPAVTFFEPSRKIAWASTVAVVVPSPATSEVLEATSRTIWAPMFSSCIG